MTDFHTRALHAVLSPAELGPFQTRASLSTVCVVFDVLRATSTMVTALSQGARAIVPYSEISEALAARAKAWTSSWGTPRASSLGKRSRAGASR
jgi:phosphosulfolactate phosphohydrolase-like enzyme